MSETAQHQIGAQNSSLAAVDALSTLDLTGLSYIQLHRLHKVLLRVCDDVARETEMRAENDNSGDTVRVPSPKL
jgi:hypothetical protein